jgi:hypothetical protein
LEAELKRILWVFINSLFVIGGLGLMILGVGLLVSTSEWIAWILMAFVIIIACVCILNGTRGIRSELAETNQEQSFDSMEE